ncbi:flagellar motor protein MotB [Clostridium oceanicum]|uniref:OmpA family protein n=1 Tax=Clostridium oceanicum TaxID=1543 RepID=A0ABN1JTF7_9CLOT
MSRRKKKSSSPGLTGDEWIQTYSDTITLLLTFFVLLYSFSTVDAQKFKQIAASFQTVMTGDSGKTIVDYNMKDGDVPLVGETVKMGREKGSNGKDIYDQVNSYLNNNKLKGSVKVAQDSRGVVMQLKDNIIFESGRAEIKTNSKPILDKLNGLLTTFPNDIIVEGHTDNLPIKNNKYDSNWELSTDRATNVLRYFVETKKQDPNRFSASGYGEHRPIAPNNSDINRAKNRRVNILIVSKEKGKMKDERK